MHEHLLKLENSLAFLQTPASDSGLAFGGVGGGGMMTTVLRKHTKHTKQYHHKSRFTRYLPYFRDVGLCYIVSTPTLLFRTVCETLEIGWGVSFFFADST